MLTCPIHCWCKQYNNSYWILSLLARIKVLDALPAHWPLVLDAGTVLVSVPPVQVLCIVITQGGGQWAVHSAEGCCKATAMALKLSIKCKLPGLVSKPGVIIHGCCWEAEAVVSALIAAAAAVAACCCNCNCICCCCNKNNSKWEGEGETTHDKTRHQRWEDNSSLRNVPESLGYKQGAIGNQTIW